MKRLGGILTPLPPPTMECQFIIDYSPANRQVYPYTHFYFGFTKTLPKNIKQRPDCGYNLNLLILLRLSLLMAEKIINKWVNKQVDMQMNKTNDKNYKNSGKWKKSMQKLRERKVCHSSHMHFILPFMIVELKKGRLLEFHFISYHKYTPKSSTCVVTRKSAMGDMAKLVTGDSTRKQSISLTKRERYLSNWIKYKLLTFKMFLLRAFIHKPR